VITRHFPTLFLHQSLRALARHPGLLVLNVLGIALGVAVFLAIQTANRSANESFRAGIELVAGRANLEVRGDLDETLFPRIARLPGVRSATPLVEGVASLPGFPGEYLRLVGVDPFTGDELRTFELLGAERSRIDLDTWLGDPLAIAVSREYSERVLPRLGGELRIRTETGPHTLRPAFVLEPALASGDPRIAAMDIGWAQEILGRQGRLTAILVLADPAKLADVRAVIRDIVPADVQVDSPRRRSAQVESMIGAFQLNLTALSLVSVLVGGFLIYNTVSAVVVRRRAEIGVLRAIGATRSEVRLLFLGEAALAGLAGAALGSALSLPLAQALSAPLTETIRTLYILTSVEQLHLSPWQLVEALAVGLGAALLAAWIPANEAAGTEPGRVLRPGSQVESDAPVPRRALPVALISLALAVALGWVTLAFDIPALGFAATLGVLTGFSLLVPGAISLCGRLLRARRSPLGLAAANLSRAMHRNAITIAALAAAIAMAVSVTVMIHSFRASVDEWIGSTLVDDLYIGPASDDIRTALPPGAVAWLRAQPGVENVSTRADGTVSLLGEPVSMAVVESPRPGSLRMLQGRFADLTSGDSLLVSEPLANRLHLRAGQMLDLPTPRGRHRFRVAGVFQDYARSAGLVMIDRSNYEKHWNALPAQAAAVQMTRSSDAAALGEAFRARYGAAGAFSIFSNAALRARVFDIFDQTFAVTIVLRAIAVVVAVAGVTLSLLILVAEREREIGVLRSIGASRGQIAGLFLREAALIGLLASVVGVASGSCLAMMLTWVINKAFFGWTIRLDYPIDALLATPLWILPAALLAALLPAWRAAHVAPARAVRFE
jgi:putative ABC transport system permease protein